MARKNALRTALTALTAAGLFCVLSASWGGQGLQARKGQGRPAGPLVRKDLLEASGDDGARVIRDIFAAAPQAAAAGAGGRGRKPAAQPAEVKPPEVELAYLGFVRSGDRVTAIVVFQGQTLTVSVDEEVTPGHRVTRLTPDEIEVVGPDGARKVFHRQGERS